MSVREMVTENPGLKVLSFLLAVLLWLSVTGATEGETAVTVPVRFRNLAPQLVVTTKVPSAIEVRVAGPKLRLLRLAGEHLTVTLDLQGAGEGDVTFADLERSVALPAGLRITRVYPATVELRLARADKQK